MDYTFIMEQPQSVKQAVFRLIQVMHSGSKQAVQLIDNFMENATPATTPGEYMDILEQAQQIAKG